MNLGRGHKIKKEDDYTMYGTMVYDYQKKSIGLLIKTWDNGFWDNSGFKYYNFATVVDKEGKRYGVPMEDITPVETMDEEELKRLGLK